MEPNRDGSLQIDSRAQLVIVAWAGGCFAPDKLGEEDPLYCTPFGIAEQTPLVEVEGAYGKVPADQIKELERLRPESTEVKEFVETVIEKANIDKAIELDKLPWHAFQRRSVIKRIYRQRANILNQLPVATNQIRSTINEVLGSDRDTLPPA